MIYIVNYNLGNLLSVKKALERINVKSEITSDYNLLKNADKIILPGVGHFSKAVDFIKTLGLWELLNDLALNKKIPFLGICLGIQLMAEKSEEGNVNGFGFIDAEVVRFRIKDSMKFKIPNTGWNNVEYDSNNLLFNGIDKNAEFYFVHSYHIICKQKENIIGVTNYEYDFASAVQKDNLFGVQFHPENSHRAGEQLLRNFSKL